MAMQRFQRRHIIGGCRPHRHKTLRPPPGSSGVRVLVWPNPAPPSVPVVGAVPLPLEGGYAGPATPPGSMRLGEFGVPCHTGSDGLPVLYWLYARMYMGCDR